MVIEPLPSPLAFQLGGVRMAVASTAETGAVSAATVLVFEQIGDIVSGRYRGGSIVDGYLIGSLTGNILHFRYVQADASGQVDAGVSQGELVSLADGRIRMIERFVWTTRQGTGTNVFEEIQHACEP